MKILKVFFAINILQAIYQINILSHIEKTKIETVY